MKFSTNPYTDELEVYSDDWEFMYSVPSFGPEDSEMAEDGGPGSGNFGHEGRPGQVGGSGEGDGESPGSEKSPESKSIPPKVKSHIEKYRSRLNSAIESDKYSGKNGLFSAVNSVGGSIFGEDVYLGKSNEELIPIIERYLDVLGKSGEQPEKMTYKAGRKLGEESGRKFLENIGYRGYESKKAYETLVEYTEGDWKKVDQDFLDDYVSKRLKTLGAFEGVLYRGQHITRKEYQQLKSDVANGVIRFDRVCSWSANGKTADEFAAGEHYKNENPKNTYSVVFLIARGGNKSAVPVTEFSRFIKEEEMLSKKGTEYNVISAGWSTSGVSGRRGYSPYVVTLVERGKDDGK